MRETDTPTPLSEAVARLTHYLSAGLLDTYGVGSMQEHPRLTAEEALEHDIQRLLDAVAEGREDSKRLDFLASDNNAALGPTFHKAIGNFGTLVQVNGSRAWGFTMREAIDAAMSDAQSPPPAPTEPG